MSDTAQGPGWWQTADGRWYPPESHPEYSPRGRLGAHDTTASQPGAATSIASTGAGAATTVMAPGAPLHTQPTLRGVPPGPPRAHEPTVAWPAERPWQTTTAPELFTPLRVTGLVGLGLAIVGVFMSWATATSSLLGTHLTLHVAGTHLQAGRVFIGVLVVVIVCGWWHLATSGRLSGVALSAAWLTALAVAVYKMVALIAVPTYDYVTLDIGLGLYLCGLGALLATVCSLADLAQHWSASAPGTDAAPVLAVGGLAVVAALGLAAGFGSQPTSNPLGKIPHYVPSHVGGSGTSGSSRSGGGLGGSGGTGDSGGTGASGGSGGSGTTGSTGNSGLGNSGLGNSGLGNSGAGNSGFGNSGVGNSGFGNSGSGNSGLGNSGTGNSGLGNSGNSGDGSI